MIAPGSLGALGALARGVRHGFRIRFLAQLVRELDLAHARRVDRRFRTLIRDARAEAADDRALTHLTFTALALALYQETLAGGLDRDAAFALTRKVFLAAARSPPWLTLLIRMGVRPWDRGSAFARIAANYLARGRRLFGTGFEYRAERDTPEHVFVAIQRCLYHQYFTRHGAPELTQIFCAWDGAWADELDRPGYDAAFARPTRLALGDDACRFQFTRIRPRPS